MSSTKSTGALTAGDARVAAVVRAAEYWARTVAEEKAMHYAISLGKPHLDATVREWRALDPQGFAAYMDRLRTRDEATR
jgi:hypothetical protein